MNDKTIDNIFKILNNSILIYWNNHKNFWYVWIYEDLYQYFFWASNIDNQISRYYTLIDWKQQILNDNPNNNDIINDIFDNISNIYKENIKYKKNNPNIVIYDIEWMNINNILLPNEIIINDKNIINNFKNKKTELFEYVILIENLINNISKKYWCKINWYNLIDNTNLEII